MREREVFLIGGAGEEKGLVSWSETADPCRLVLSYRGRLIEAEANDYFEAFCNIRIQLEADRLIPFCYGASLNVYPSGMCRDMGKGLTAYKMTMGKHTRREDLVYIFDEGPDVIPTHVSRQKEFWEEWLKTPRA